MHDRVSGGLVAAGLLSRTTRRRLAVRSEVLTPTDPALLARIQSEVLHAVYGRRTTETPTAVLCGLIGVLRLERTLDIGGSTADALRRLRELSDYHYPVAGPILALINDLLGEAAVAAYG